MRKSQARTGHRPLKALAAAAFATSVVLAGTAGPAQAGATLTLSQTQVAITGGTVLYISGGTGLASTQGIRFTPSSGSCPATYDAATPAGTVNGGLITAVNVNTAWVTTPAMPAGTYKPCLYLSATNGAPYTTDTFAASGNVTVTAVNMATLSPTTGAAGDKVTMTASSAIFTAASYGTEFVSGVTACPTTYTAAGSTVIVGTTVKTSTEVLTVTVPSTLTTGTPYYVCSYAGTTAGSALAAVGKATFASFDSALPPVTLSPTGGGSGASTIVTISVPTTSAVFTGTPNVLLTRNACPLVRPADAALGGTTGLEPYAVVPTKISNSKLYVTMPSTVIGGGGVATWNICTYASVDTGAVLVADPATYTVAPAMTWTAPTFAVGGTGAALTGSGPAQGGSQITISALDGIPTTPGALLSASLGGSPIDITTVNSSTSFTGITSAHAPGAVALSVTTAAGTRTTIGLATPLPYTYTYGITVTPNTAASGTTPVLDIAGAGFASLSFADVLTGAGPVANKSYVLLTNNTWNAQTFSGIGAMAVAPTSYCNGVLPISDKEIICTLNLTAMIDPASAANVATITAGTDVPAGTYTITVANDADNLESSNSDLSITSSGSTFTVAPF